MSSAGWAAVGGVGASSRQPPAGHRLVAVLEYHPVLADAPKLVVDSGPRRLLVVGDEVPDSVTPDIQVRVLGADPDEVELSSGVYRFADGDGAAVMVVSIGGPPAEPLRVESADDGHPLSLAAGWFEHWWADGRCREVPQPRFTVGDAVVTVPAGQPGLVRSRMFVGGSWSYGVRVEGRNQQLRESSLAEPPADDDPADWMRRPAAPAARFSATLTRAKLREQLTDTVYSFRASRTIFRPYQFRPVIRLLATTRLRLLIADEVGLGKTIEAGLVWTELDARGLANRVLVVCPSMLVSKWRAEMDERFGFELDHLRREQLDEMLNRIGHDRLPRRFHAVCSLETLRTWTGLERLSELGVHFDVVIVDEAHAFRNTGTRTFALGQLLSDWADALVFLSATPLNLGNDDLFNLLQLLAPGDFDDRALVEDRLAPNAVLNQVAASLLDRQVDNATRLGWLRRLEQLTFGPAVTGRPEFDELEALLRQPHMEAAQVAGARRLIAELHTLSAVVTRTRKVEIEEGKAVREAIDVPVQWTDEEVAFYRAFEEWQVSRARKLGLPVGFATQMPLRLAGSCLPMARQQVIDRGSGPVHAGLDRQGFDLEDPDFDDDQDGPTVDLGAPPPELVQMARDLGEVDTKFDRFLPELLKIVRRGRRVLVFTFSRATLAYLERRLSCEVRLATLHGGVAGDERHRIMREFRAGSYDVVVASRVASEGLDFEFCSAVVNYDLPWNPMEVEQRIGRVDRFGQTEEKVVVLNLRTPGTIETDIVDRLLQRIGVFESSIGELEPILQSELKDIRTIVYDFALTPEERNRRLDAKWAALEEQRRAQEDVEAAAAYLSSTDNAEIDGLERHLVDSGRYVGQVELVRLLEDWAATSPGASCRVSSDGRHLTLRGNAAMEHHLRSVHARGERSETELESLARKLRDEQDIVVALEQELARTTGEPILSAIHPLTRAALGVPGNTEARWAHLAVSTHDAPPGTYLVLVAVARWNGLRPANELWAQASCLSDGEAAPAAVASALLAGLAAGRLSGAGPVDVPEPALAQVQRKLFERQGVEEDRRRAENKALVETRRISLRGTYARKVAQIQQRIDTLRSSGKPETIPLHEAQLRNQDRLLAAEEDKLESARVGALTIEHTAVCTLVVTPT